MVQTLIAFVLGTIDAALPKRWRHFGRRSSEQFMARCGIASGVLESVLAMGLLRLWYVAFFGSFADAYARSVAEGKDLRVTPEAAGAAGFAVLAANPVTWIILYFLLEGAVRATAAIATGDVFGVLPLSMIDRLIRKAARRSAPAELPLIVDEVLPGDASCDFKIASCRRRSEWTFPFALRYRGGFFQVNGSQCLGSGPRPYIYSFRRLPPGENARGLRAYHPEDVLTEIVRGYLND
jgi:hypothetical protein